jgi:hypothetical protein
MTKRQEIIAVLEYRDGDYYVGGHAQAHVAYIVGARYTDGNLVSVIEKAPQDQILIAWNYLRKDIKYMKAHPVVECPCCGTIVRTEEIQKRKPVNQEVSHGTQEDDI